MDFRAGREDGPLSDGEIIDENETAAEKRVRLAKSYLAKVKQDLEAGTSLVLVTISPRLIAVLAQVDGDYDAAEIDRELIASRLQKDVVGVDRHIREQRLRNRLNRKDESTPIWVLEYKT